MSDYFQSYSRTLKTEGIVMLLLGILAIVLPQAFTLGIELLVGALFLIGGALSVVRGFQLKGLSGRSVTIVMGILTAMVGLVLLAFPTSGTITLTLLVGALFLIQGVAEVVAALQHKRWRTWGWILISGIASLIIGILLISGLPGTASWAIGLLIGINLLFTGVWLLTFAKALDAEVSS
ncbi:hypothetical protein HMF8227_02917 [Saliniradius amylolyticus]|uniref:Acid-resistance membrane protein n=1 Tax=Saliniradius amylolyticus TaxID=2183582 RepID=A0A2S2E6V9_9ALTE|nr:DUF308 domain-containing protein [Saliniradius amylolyticus]AWL13365.1 hypothetical protein HMF8227_02917 [Saliniradius amylolyticus]